MPTGTKFPYRNIEFFSDFSIGTSFCLTTFQEVHELLGVHGGEDFMIGLCNFQRLTSSYPSSSHVTYLSEKHVLS